MTTSLTESLQQQQQYIAEVLQRWDIEPQIICCKDSTDSTNDDALQLFKQGYTSALVISQQQQHGRGQHRRSWVSQPGNLFFSALLPLQRNLDGRLSLECGLNLLHHTGLSALNGLQLKWANDLYSPHGKWGGILIEPVHPQQVIIGIGINIITVQSTIDQAHTSLTQLGFTPPTLPFLAAEVYHACTQAVQWFNHDCPQLAQRFNAVCAFIHQNVILQRPQQTIRGILRGIQDDGALILENPENQQRSTYYDGRLSLEQCT